MYLVGDFIPQGLRPECRGLPLDELVLANLEGPVCDQSLSPVPKTGIHLNSRKFRLSGKWAFSLANNHLMDFGVDGLRQTVEYLDEQGWKHAGAGMRRAEAREPMYLEENGCRVAVFSCCERQYGMASSTRPGVADKGNWLLDEVRKIKLGRHVKYVVVCCHAASEFSPFVSPSLRSFYHELIDAGADVVHGHHSHVPQGWERYRNSYIYYGLGNYIVNADQWAGRNQGWSRVAHVEFSDAGIAADPPTVFVCRKSEGCAVSEPASLRFGETVRMYCDIIDRQCSDYELCTALWQESCVRLYHRVYAQGLRAPSTEHVSLSARAAARKLFFAIQDLAKILLLREIPTRKSIFYASCLGNYFQCESHVDVIGTALGVLTGSIEDLRTEETKRLAMECGL